MATTLIHPKLGTVFPKLSRKQIEERGGKEILVQSRELLEPETRVENKVFEIATERFLARGAKAYKHEGN